MHRLEDASADLIRKAKRNGFSDQQLGLLVELVGDRGPRRPASGWASRPPSSRSTRARPSSRPTRPTTIPPTKHEDETPGQTRPADRRIMILGGGPNRIGQGIEFDYCCCHASFALQELGIESIMVNSNPETVSTDYDTSDYLFFEPLTTEDVLNICDRMQPDGVIVQFGGQTPLNLARGLEAAGVKIIGTSPDMIDVAEDRERFQAMLQKIRPAAAAQRDRHRRRGRAQRGASGSAIPCSCGPATSSAAGRWKSATTKTSLIALHGRGGRCLARSSRADRQISARTPSKSTSTRSPTAADDHRRRDGAHRRGRRALGRLGLLTAPLFAAAAGRSTKSSRRPTPWPASCRFAA